MNIDITTPGIHHVSLRVRNFERAKEFYVETLGFHPVMEAPGLFIFMAGRTAIGIQGPTDKTPDEDVFDPFRVGLDHLAFACEDEAELERVAAALKASDVVNTGLKTDETLGKRYIAFKDPDRIAWEFYMA